MRKSTKATQQRIEIKVTSFRRVLKAKGKRVKLYWKDMERKASQKIWKRWPYQSPCRTWELEIICEKFLKFISRNFRKSKLFTTSESLKHELQELMRRRTCRNITSKLFISLCFSYLLISLLTVHKP